jgi:hypothetical protein
MRKSIVSLSKTSSSPSSDSTLDRGLDIAQIASVEISSEDAQHPFENALQGGKGGGWKAADPGPQVIRLNFDHPQSIRRIRLEFREQTRERSQEFALFASSAAFQKRQLVRQQWTFSPGGSAIEVEDYSLDLTGVLSLELEIDPGRHDKQAIATLESLTIA